ncbi:GNAT family N-acetyltransferase [Actinoplanes sp. NPDC000266]
MRVMLRPGYDETIDRMVVAMRIERIIEASAVHAAAELFDTPPLPGATERFLASDGHHLLLAYDDDGVPVGMISGVELTHPDKGTEMFIYELGVSEGFRRHGVATRLVEELAGIARRAGCYGMWVGTEPDNAAARATYRRAGASEEAPFTLLNWDFIDGERA